MRKFICLLLAFNSIMHTVGCAEENALPVIDQFTLPDTAEPGSRVTFHAVAHDAEGDPLSYIWVVDGTRLEDTTPTVEWTVPEIEGEVTIEVRVSDGENEPTVQRKVLAIGSMRLEPPEVVPPVDLSKHSVPLEQVYFDTFRPTNRAVPLSEASPDLITELRDAIPPLNNPKYETATEATWLNDKDIVLGYANDGGVWAYPVRILNFHEIVNDTFAGEPTLISYCPLCFSGIVFSRRVGNRELTFGNTSALYESDMVMLDYQTGSYWWQVAGQAIVGTLTGETLMVMPSIMTSWAEWRRLHPATQVLSRDTGFPRNYDWDVFAGYADRLNEGDFAFPVSDASRDSRLPPAARVLVVKVGGQARAYPLEQPGDSAIMEIVGGKDIAVFIDADGPTGVAYEATSAGNRLTFEVQSGRFVDQETRSIWDVAGRAIGGPLKGTQLTQIASKTTFWFAAVAAEPTVTVYN